MRTEPDNMIQVGTIVHTHGVRGDVKVLPLTDDPDRLLQLKRLYIGEPAQSQEVEVKSAWPQHTSRGLVIVMHLDGYESMDQAEKLLRSSVYASAEDLPALADDEVFLHDLIGFTVISDEGTTIGTLKDILELPAQNLYVVEREDNTDVLVPAVKEFVQEVDTDARRIIIRPIEGLID